MSITKRSIALELNVIMVIRPACLYGDEARGHYAGWTESLCIRVSEYMSVLIIVSACVSTDAIRCIMYVFRILKISGIQLMNAEVSDGAVSR